MNKRTFLKQLGLGTGAALAFPTFFTGCEATPNEDFKLWVWTGGDDKTSEDWKQEFTKLKEAGFHGVLVGGGHNTLPTAIPEAKALGLEIHAWVWTMNQPGDKEAQAHPEWYAVSREGNSSLDVRPYVDYYQWLCPNKPEVQEYIFNKMMDICDLEGLDGVQLDYVRFCDVILPPGLWSKYDLVQDHEMPEYDFCYCDTCRDKFKAKSGYDPLDKEDPSQDEDWRQFRYDSITEVVNKIAVGVHERKKKLSASVFASPSLARKFVRQAWDDWDLDFVFPMIYYKMYDEPVEFVKTATREGVDALKGSKPLYTAQYLHDKNAEEVRQSIEMAKAGGCEGLAVFNYSLLSDEFLEVIKAAQKA